MAYLQFDNIKIRGMAACVPSKIEENKDLPFFPSEEDYERFVSVTGIHRRHISSPQICTSDMCLAAAQKLIEELRWDKKEIGCLIFVSQTPDYIYPATSCVLQGKLGLSPDCMSFDISMGCSGWVYGLSVISSLIGANNIKKALLLVGDTVTKTKSPFDKSAYPLFGDAGTATALESCEKSASLCFNLQTDGTKYSAIIIPEGGFRNMFNEESLKMKTDNDGIMRCGLNSKMNGASIFTFSILRAPQSINALMDHFCIDKNEIDYFVFHQANLMMNEQIRKKLKIEPERCPYIFNEFGNNSSASIPLTIVTQLKKKLMGCKAKIISSGFGVGLSWGSAFFELDNIKCCDLIEI